VSKRTVGLIGASGLLILFTLELGMLAALEAAPPFRVQSPAVQPAPSADQWGAPIDGVQLKLTVSKTKPRLPGQLPPLETQIRNQGSGSVTFVAEAIVLPNIEIDGVWYSQAWAGSCCTNPTKIDPGVTSDALPVAVNQSILFELNARPARTVTWRPGKHSIRVRSTASDLFYVQSSTGRRLTLVSNTITIDVPNPLPR
jgi:hypothetical protein